MGRRRCRGDCGNCRDCAAREAREYEQQGGAFGVAGAIVSGAITLAGADPEVKVARHSEWGGGQPLETLK